ncbi:MULTISPECIES: sulfur carrier protein ThiS [Massilia]|jgi:sulfur carrier protein|uniref:sulfur carrier protein ThiS n=1 Tax=Massilia TaxID=149698 RepID=UPI001AE2CE12|nr:MULTISPECIES: sulfur carrier protein ThiS [Massilia]
MTEIELNGALYQVPAGVSLLDLAGQLGLAEQAVAVAVNREVVPRQQWPQRRLQARDKVDIVRAIGGG